MKPPVSDSTQDTRRRLLEAALVVFADKGFSGAGIREIAERAKANSAMVQYHFGGKEGIYIEALRYAFEQGPKWIHLLPPPPNPGEDDARAKALARFKDYIHNFLRDFMECHCGVTFLSAEVDQAAHILWSRAPTSTSIRWLSVPPLTSRKPLRFMPSASAWALLTICSW